MEVPFEEASAFAATQPASHSTCKSIFQNSPAWTVPVPSVQRVSRRDSQGRLSGESAPGAGACRALHLRWHPLQQVRNRPDSSADFELLERGTGRGGSLPLVQLHGELRGMQDSLSREAGMTDSRFNPKDPAEERESNEPGTANIDPQPESHPSAEPGGLTWRSLSEEEGEAHMMKVAEELLGRRGISPSSAESDGTKAEDSAQAAESKPTDADPTLLPVPPGLFRCPVCDGFRGTIALADDSVHSRHKGDALTIRCICDGIPCPQCKVNRIYRPISNMWSQRGGLGHIPYFAAMAWCNECAIKRNAEWPKR